MLEIFSYAILLFLIYKYVYFKKDNKYLSVKDVLWEIRKKIEDLF